MEKRITMEGMAKGKLWFRFERLKKIIFFWLNIFYVALILMKNFVRHMFCEFFGYELILSCI